MWDSNDNYDVRDGARGVVRDTCWKGLILALENGQEAFAFFSGLRPGTEVFWKKSWQLKEGAPYDFARWSKKRGARYPSLDCGRSIRGDRLALRQDLPPCLLQVILHHVILAK